jgi:DNA-binding NarL/FixJ family response regulator
MSPPSDTEVRIAELMADGLDNVTIRERLRMRAAQVTGYVARIRKRLGPQAA